MKRLNFVVEDDVYERIENLKKRTEARSLAEVFRDALRVYDWVLSEIAKGQEIVARPPGEETGPLIRREMWRRKPTMLGKAEIPEIEDMPAIAVQKLDKNAILGRLGQFIDEAKLLKQGDLPNTIALQKKVDLLSKLNNLSREIEENIATSTEG